MSRESDHRRRASPASWSICNSFGMQEMFCASESQLYGIFAMIGAVLAGLILIWMLPELYRSLGKTAGVTSRQRVPSKV